MSHTRVLGRLVFRCLTGALWFGLAHSTPMPGQVAGGTIQGLVSDPSGATVAGAQVTVTGKATGLKREVSSNSTGFYAVPDLQPAAYTVTVAANGFSSKTVDTVTLTVGANLTINVTLSVGSSTEQVE